MKMSAVKNLTFFNLYVSFFLFYMQIFLPYVILVTSTFKFVVIRRFVTSKGSVLEYTKRQVKVSPTVTESRANARFWRIPRTEWLVEVIIWNIAHWK